MLASHYLPYTIRPLRRIDPMQLEHLLLFLTVTLFVSASPGPVMLSCMAYGGQVGLKRTTFAILGASTGNLCLILLSAVGASVLLKQYPWLFRAVQIGGALWLFWLGLQVARKPLTRIQSVTVDVLSAWQLWWRSFVVAISNPKGLIYFGALFPQFIQADQPALQQYTALTTLFLIIDMSWMLLYAAGGKVIMGWIKNPRHERGFNWASGAALMLAGGFLLFSL